MSVLIKGMEMPKSCGQCRFFVWSRGVGQHCAVDDRITFHATIDGLDVGYERNGDCPLVPVPPHGRLIDADALAEKHRELAYELRGANYDFHMTACSWVNNASTIIPAEEGEG